MKNKIDIALIELKIESNIRALENGADIETTMRTINNLLMRKENLLSVPESGYRIPIYQESYHVPQRQ